MFDEDDDDDDDDDYDYDDDSNIYLKAFRLQTVNPVPPLRESSISSASAAPVVVEAGVANVAGSDSLPFEPKMRE